MSKLEGINVPMGIVPNDSQDQYPTHYAMYGHGGYRSVESVGDMMSIPIERLEAGCMCYVRENDVEYRWIDGQWVVSPRGEQTDYNDLLQRIESLEQNGNVDVHKEMSYNTPSIEWRCQHNIGKKPSVTVVDGSGNLILADVLHVNENYLIVTFGMNVTGRIILN